MTFNNQGALPPLAQDLATMSQQKSRDEIEEAIMRRTILSGEHSKATATTSYVCDKCDSRECLYTMMIPKADFGKSETWGSKDKSAGCIHITCQKCQNQWKKEL